MRTPLLAGAAVALGTLLWTGSAARADGVPATPGPADVGAARRGLADVRRELKANQEAVRKQSEAERDELGVLGRLNRELEAARRDADTHRHNLDLVRQRLGELKEAADRVSQDEDLDRDALRAALRGLYRSRTDGQGALLLSARDPQEARTRARYLASLAAAVALREQALGRDRERLDAYRREFDGRYDELQRHVAEVEDDQRRVERERRAKEEQLREVRGRKARALHAVAQLRRAEDRLQGMLDDLQRQMEREEEAERAAEERARESASAGAPQEAEPETGANPSPGAYRGRGLHHGLPWPVDGPILSAFGKHLHPVFHVPVFNRGIEIGAGFGAPVRAVAAGRVDFAGEMEGFGRLVVLDHGRGMLSVYGYGSRLLVRKGQVVAQGDVLEDAGEADGSRQPSVYFEIRKGVRAQDPLEYLGRR